MADAMSISPAAGLAALTAQTEAQKRGQIKQTAQNFESSFLSVMMQSMFQGVDENDPMGGGKGEEMFRSLLTESMAKQVAKSGGIGLAPTIEREMLKMQGLS
ncbi:MAG: Flagellar protein FlgJ-like protein [Caulobacteraceae bacterium]|nr:Flagellar protein FlgJ-like protein [Caulobacteraceae bacterium]